MVQEIDIIAKDALAQEKWLHPWGLLLGTIFISETEHCII